MAVVVTMYVMGAINEKEATADATTPHEQRVAILSVKTIPAGAEIDEDAIVQKEISKSSIFEDALHDTNTVVGRHALHKIPARQQIRAIDLQ
jgi:Flp pilus assembly protein CpaB